MYVGFLRILSAMDTKTEEKFLASLIPAAFLDLFFDSCHLTHWCFVNLHKMYPLFKRNLIRFTTEGVRGQRPQHETCVLLSTERQKDWSLKLIKNPEAAGACIVWSAALPSLAVSVTSIGHASSQFPPFCWLWLRLWLISDLASETDFNNLTHQHRQFLGAVNWSRNYTWSILKLMIIT